MKLTYRKYGFNFTEWWYEYDGVRPSGWRTVLLVRSLVELPALGKPQAVKKTPIIDLAKNEADIFASFNDTTRNEIRRTDKFTEWRFEVKENVDETAYQVYARQEVLQGRAPRLLRSLAHNVAAVAYYRDMPYAVITARRVAPLLKIETISSERLETDDKELKKSLAMASRRVVWELCRYAKEQGFKGLDMGYVNLSDPARAGIDRFKMGFGGEVVTEYSYTVASAAYRTLYALLRWFNHLRGVIKI